MICLRIVFSRRKSCNNTDRRFLSAGFLRAQHVKRLEVCVWSVFFFRFSREKIENQIHCVWTSPLIVITVLKLYDLTRTPLMEYVDITLMHCTCRRNLQSITSSHSDHRIMDGSLPYWLSMNFKGGLDDQSWFATSEEESKKYFTRKKVVSCHRQFFSWTKLCDLLYSKYFD